MNNQKRKIVVSIPEWLRRIPTKAYVFGGIISTLMVGILNLQEIKTIFWGTSGHLKVTNVNTDCDRKDKSCLLDITVLNAGQGVTTVEGVLLRVAGLQNTNEILPLRASGDSVVDISALYRAGELARCRVSRVIPPQQADRIPVYLKATSDGYLKRTWRFDVTLDTSDGQVEVGQITIELVP